MVTALIRNHAIAVTTVAAAAVAVILTTVGLRLPLGDEGGHAASHLAGGIPALLLLVAARRIWPKPTPDRPSRVARAVLIAGLAIFGGGQVIEAVGAFGYDGYERVNGLAALHDLGLLLGPLGMLVAAAGVVLSLLVAVAVRRPSVLQSRWLTIAVVAAVIVLSVFVLAGLFFGF